MAKNQTMAIKHNLAKRYAIKQMTEDANNSSCATKCVKQSESVVWNMGYKPYSIFYKREKREKIHICR